MKLVFDPPKSRRDLPEAGERPWGIQIQTVSGCNAYCEMCPARRRGEASAARPALPMSDDLFDRIVEDLDGIQVVGAFLCSEPLLDDRLAERIARIHQRWPAMTIVLTTNGALLTAARSRALFRAGLNALTVSLYTNQPKRYQQITGLRFETAVANVEAAIGPAREAGVVLRIKALEGLITRADEAEFRQRWEAKGLWVSISKLHDRAGNVPLEGSPPPLGKAIGCADYDRPWRTIHVLHDGRVVLCCNDYRAMHVLGDLSCQRIRAVWNAAPYQQVRAALEDPDGRQTALLCDRCDLAVRPG